MMAPLVFIAVVLALGLGFVTLRRIETARGVRVAEGRRAAFDAYSTELVEAMVQGGVPVAWRKAAVAVLHEVTHAGVRAAVETVRGVERPLARLSYKLRVSAPKQGGAPVSEFLRTITPERK